MSVIFDRAQHKYRLDTGRELLGVTETLTLAGLIESRWFTERSAQLGTYVHAAVALLHEDDLDIDSLDPELRGYVQAYRAFEQQSGFVREQWEEQVCDEVLGVAGRLDLRGVFPRPALKYPGVDVIDIKTGSVPPWVGYQTAGYARMLPRPIPMIRWRWCLQLSADGAYRLHELTNRHDEKVFCAAVTIAQAKKGWLV